RSRRRYGGYVVHLGVISVFVAIAASSAFRVEVTQPLKRGEEMQAGKFRLRYEQITTSEDAHLSRLTAQVSVWQNGQRIAMLAPEKRFYKKPQQPTTEVAMRATLTAELYLLPVPYDAQPPAPGVWPRVVLMAWVNINTMWPVAAARRVGAVAGGGARVPAEWGWCGLLGARAVLAPSGHLALDRHPPPPRLPRAAKPCA